jgi:hypothetical protein
MAFTLTHADAARFLRTLRVTTQTALAQHALRPDSAVSASFLALAAKGTGEWKFPAAGIASADGLLLARIVRNAGETPCLEIQAQGLSGLQLYVGRGARVALSAGLSLEGVFDRDGRLRLFLDGSVVDEVDLSAFDLHLTDEKP